MEKKKRKKHPIRNAFLLLLAVVVVAGLLFSHFGGFGTGPSASPLEFALYAGQISDISIPSHTRVVALGEATHGNAEFQQLKLDVFRVMVEKYGVRSFALEGDYGGCEAVNRFVNGGPGTAREASEAIGFAIYRTKEMEDLIAWIRAYNEKVGEGERIRFYGFDMQRISYNYRYLLEAAQDAGLDTQALEGIWDEGKDGFLEDVDVSGRKELLEELRKGFEGKESRAWEQAIHLVDILIQNGELGQVENSTAGTALRDRFMAENVLWILKQEEERGNGCIFLSCHNGHMERFGTYGKEGAVMGNLLADELGEAYYAIGTDFYKSRCNLSSGREGRRKVHTFYSYDMLAKASYQCGFEISWLDFAAVPEDSALGQQIHDYGWMGSLGERYSLLMAVLPMAYRIWRSPALLYDSMIFVSEAEPIEIRE